MERYYVVETHPRAEAVAQENLLAKQFEVFLPTMIIERRVNRIRTTIMEPLFPSYLFVKFDIENDPWRQVFWARGVKTLLGPDPERPVPVGIGVIEAIRENCLVGAYAAKASNIVDVGQMARVLTGMFAGRVGKCTWARAGRVKLLLCMFGNAMEISFDENVVASAA